jgi:hypothetical protein
MALKSVLTLFILIFAASAIGRAQTCLGLPSFAQHAVHINFAAEFPDSATEYAVGIGAGHHNNLFGNLGGGQVSYDGLDGKSTFGFLEFGYQLPLAGAQLCPVAGGVFAAGPDDDLAGIKTTSRSASIGLAFGYQIGRGQFALIPNLAVNYSAFSQKVQDADGSLTDNSNSGTFDLGLSVVISNTFSIQPIVHLPFNSPDNRKSFGVFASVGVAGPK